MTKHPKTIWVALVIISISLFPFILGIASLYLYGEATIPKWRSLGFPPEEPVRFLAGTVGNDDNEGEVYSGRETTVYVETINGNIYQCCSNDNFTWTEIKRDEIESVNMVDYCLKGSKDENQQHIEDEIDNYALYWCGESDLVTAYYSLQKDGSVWIWKQYSRWIDGSILFIKSFCVGIFLIFAGAVILEFRRRKSQK